MMLLYLFSPSSSFVTVIGCCSSLLLYLRLLLIINFIGYLCFTTPGAGPGPRSSISVYTGPDPQFVFACFLQPKFVIVTKRLYTCTYFLSIIWEISKLFEISSQEIFAIFLIGYNWSHFVHFHFVIQLLQLFYFDLIPKNKNILND